MKTLEFDIRSSILSEDLPEPDLEYYKPTCELKWAKNHNTNITLLQKYECRFPEKSLDPIWFPIRFTD